MPAVARLNDPCSGHGDWPVRSNVEASPNVFVNGLGAHRVGDAWAAHTNPTLPETHAGFQSAGAASVYVNGRRLARVGDAVSCGSTVREGSLNVNCGDNAPVPVPLSSGEMDVCSVEIVPAIMHNKGWHKAAALMERWFAGPPNEKAVDGVPDTQTISLDWVLSFPRVFLEYQNLLFEMLTGPAWFTTKAKELLRDRLKENNLWEGGSFNPFTLSLPEAHKSWHIQTYYFKDGIFNLLDLDEMSAALHNFSFHIFPVGHVNVSANGKRDVTVTGAGIYLRDNFDFHDAPNAKTQPLGHWYLPDQVNLFGPGCEMSNEKFQYWRLRHGRGHDYIIYSDARYISDGLPRKIQFSA
ncbi:DUF6402 family protein [Azospirillum doebereinerae]